MKETALHVELNQPVMALCILIGLQHSDPTYGSPSEFHPCPPSPFSIYMYVANNELFPLETLHLYSGQRPEMHRNPVRHRRIGRAPVAPQPGCERGISGDEHRSQKLVVPTHLRTDPRWSNALTKTRLIGVRGSEIRISSPRN